ncbi:MAG TPA: hypothetical protein VFA78_09655, partial [Chloroflexota bacterium]|nr:hypothetical protein [Chloroflexota bacterium]
MPAQRPTAAELERNATIERILGERLPEDWTAESRISLWAPQQQDVDVLLTLKGPEGQVATIAVAVRSPLEGRMVPLLAQQLRGYNPDIPHMALAPYIAPSTQRALRENRIGYAD